MVKKAFLLLAALLYIGCGDAPRPDTPLLPDPPPLPVLSSMALTAEAGDGKVHLRWNPQSENEHVIGWRVRLLLLARDVKFDMRVHEEFGRDTRTSNTRYSTSDDPKKMYVERKEFAQWPRDGTPLTEPEFVVEGLTNGIAYTFEVVGVYMYKDHAYETRPSNTVTVTPGPVGSE